MPPYTETLSAYPIGQALGYGMPQAVTQGGPASGGNIPALSPPNTLAILGSTPPDKYLAALKPKIDRYYEVMMTRGTTLMIERPVRPMAEPNPVRLIPATWIESIQVTYRLQRVQPGAEQTTPIPAEQQKAQAPSDSVLNNLIALDAVVMLNTTVLSFVEAYLRRSTDVDEEFMVNMRELKGKLSAFTSNVDDILLHYSRCPLTSDLPQIDDVIDTCDSIKDLVSKMNVEKIHTILPNKINLTQEKVLCSVLGLNANVAHQLHELSSQKRCHQNDMYWLKHFLMETLKETLENYENEEDKTELEFDIKSVLESSGFTESRAEKTAAWIQAQNQIGPSQSLEYWITLYLENMFSCDVLLNEAPRFPYNSDKVKEWSYKEIQTEDRVVAEDDERVPPKVRVPVYNCVTKDASSIQCKDGTVHQPHEKKDGYWYHGTSHEGASNIMENGIRLNSGGKKMDFSHGDGFYVSTTYDYAIDWAKRNKQSAVIVFKIGEELLPDFTEMDLSVNTRSWEDIIKYNRCGQDKSAHKPDKSLLKEFNKADYITGPLSTDGTGRAPPINPKAIKSWKPTGFMPNDKRQLCIKSRDLAERFGDVRNIHSVIFTVPK